jgi:hypothetical protein
MNGDFFFFRAQAEELPGVPETKNRDLMPDRVDFIAFGDATPVKGTGSHADPSSPLGADGALELSM